MVEQRTENPRVGGSIPPRGTINIPDVLGTQRCLIHSLCLERNQDLVPIVNIGSSPVLGSLKWNNSPISLIGLKLTIHEAAI